ncbi:LOW QUALITY PROTEIN: patellin-3-like [Benincasa hispida]|uniref:LOW QUALITY PROTEIN: patellin-3-like n=1 Tax=Benincasa hispida TaxID=102211 RepID=UPI0019014AEF|nr:LOW QUALITY PROTEIN: patellin-3-like [Benincasa hispida]
MDDRIPTVLPLSDRPPSSTQEENPPPPLVESLSAVADSPVLPEKDSISPSEVVLESVSLATAENELVSLPPPAAVVEKEEPLQPPCRSVELDSVSVESTKFNAIEEQKIPQTSVSFKEESNRVDDLADPERKALQELRQLVEEGTKNHVFQFDTTPPSPPTGNSKLEENRAKEVQDSSLPEKKLSIWGVPLLEDDRTDVILLKFLRARDFKVRDAFIMFRNTIRWREEFGIDSLVDENLGDDLEKVVYMHGYSRESHPVCYNVFGEFQNKDLYSKMFSDEEKRTKFLRWRIQFLERSIRKLDFRPGGISTLFQVNDLKNSPGPGKRELRLATKQAVQVLQDNYPEFVAKQVFINVPWWYLAFYTMINPFLTQRTKANYIFAGSSRSAETLSSKYISPEQVPIEYGGLSVDYCDCNPDFDASDQATEVSIKPSTKQTVEIIIYEKCIIAWELRVVGWEVSYSAEFVPNTKEAYTLIIQKTRKMAATDEPVISQSFQVCELGKVLFTIDNPTSKKKKLMYRFKVKVPRE